MNRFHTFAAAALLAAFCACTDSQAAAPESGNPPVGANPPAAELTSVALECPAMD
ncbi:MAG: hypothetical protein NXI31_20990 [bacterium]|nr:hypothetical protein [bacterium]